MDLSYKQKGSSERHEPIKYYEMNDGTLIAIYQGFRGENPDLDFILKYKEKNKRLRTPSHTHWIVDLLVKSASNKEEVGNYVKDMLSWYDKLQPFSSIEERNDYELNVFSENKHQSLNSSGYYSVQTLTAFIELFSINEKQTTGAFMFKTLLELVRDYCDGKKDFYQVVGYSKRV